LYGKRQQRRLKEQERKEAKNFCKEKEIVLPTSQGGF
jgi:hypothetical protein